MQKVAQNPVSSAHNLVPSTLKLAPRGNVYPCRVPTYRLSAAAADIVFSFQCGSLINCPQNFCQKSQKNNKNEAQAMSSLTLSGAVFSLSSVLVGRLVGQVDVLGAVWSLRCTLKGTAWLLSCSTVLLCHSTINTTQIYEK